MNQDHEPLRSWTPAQLQGPVNAKEEVVGVGGGVQISILKPRVLTRMSASSESDHIRDTRIYRTSYISLLDTSCPNSYEYGS